MLMPWSKFYEVKNSRKDILILKKVGCKRQPN